MNCTKKHKHNTSKTFGQLFLKKVFGITLGSYDVNFFHVVFFSKQLVMGAPLGSSNAGFPNGDAPVMGCLCNASLTNNNPNIITRKCGYPQLTDILPVEYHTYIKYFFGLGKPAGD